MDQEQQKILLNLGDKISSIFVQFMLRTAKFEELVDIGHQFLTGFCQELETYRRPQLYKTSNVIDNIIEANHTDRMKAYIEAGSRHRYLDIQNISNLHSCSQGLQEHLTKVKVLLDELECLQEDAIDIARTINHSASQFLDKYFGDGTRHEGLSLEEDNMVEPIHLQDKSISHATLMTVIYNMLRLDYTMQENIISSVNLINTSLAQGESYCLLWDMRPYINDNVIREGWRLVPR